MLRLFVARLLLGAAAAAAAGAVAVAFDSASAFAGTVSADAAVPAASARPAAHEARALLAGLNAIRRAHGLKPFGLSARLSRAAVAHAGSMAAKGYFDHDSADGTPWDDRIAHYYPWAKTARLAENILWAPDSAGPGAMIHAWMASHGHRANILTAAFDEIGIGVVAKAAAPGVYEGRDVEIAVTDFAG